MNVIRHEHIPPYADAKANCASTIIDEGCVYFGCREDAGASVGIKRYEINRSVEALEDQIQSWRLILEHATHR
jgi:hypothetical protein